MPISSATYSAWFGELPVTFLLTKHANTVVVKFTPYISPRPRASGGSELPKPYHFLSEFWSTKVGTMLHWRFQSEGWWGYMSDMHRKITKPIAQHNSRWWLLKQNRQVSKLAIIWYVCAQLRKQGFPFTSIESLLLAWLVFHGCWRVPCMCMNPHDEDGDDGDGGFSDGLLGSNAGMHAWGFYACVDA